LAILFGGPLANVAFAAFVFMQLAGAEAEAATLRQRQLEPLAQLEEIVLLRAAAETAGAARAGAALGLQQTLLGIVVAGVPPAFAAIVDASSWRIAFAAVVAGPAAGVLALRAVPEPTTRRPGRTPGTSAIPPAAR